MKALADVSVVICTRNRAASLARTLSDLERQDLSSLTMEVIIVDNGSTDGTADLIRSPRASFRLVPLYEGVPGKSRALNLALTQHTGKLIIFTDDDVSFNPHWVSSYVRASQDFKDCAVFCGPIVPVFPSGTPSWLRKHRWNSIFFGSFDAESPEGVLPPGREPYGANVALQSAAIAGLQFRLDLGPSETNGALMSEDVDFIRRVRAQSRDCIYIPSALIDHHIRPEQISPDWLYRRSFAFGRSMMLVHKTVTIIPTYQPDESSLDDQGRSVDQGCTIHYYCGQLLACPATDISAATRLRELLSCLDAAHYLPVLADQAISALVIAES